MFRYLCSAQKGSPADSREAIFQPGVAIGRRCWRLIKRAMPFTLNPLTRRRWRMNPVIRALTASRARILATSACMVCLLVALEWRFDLEFSLGILYVIPVLTAATVLSRWQIFAAAVFCAFTRGQFWPGATRTEFWLRFAMATLAYTATGTLVSQIVRSRRTVLAHYTRVRIEQQLRRKAEEQLRLLATSSPAAILTVSAAGEIVAANRAAQAMFGLDVKLIGKPVRMFAPLFEEALSLAREVSDIRTSARTWVTRADGSHFPAATWFSIYGDEKSRHLAAILVDVSDEVREREHALYDQLVQHNRVFAGAVSHEIRNLCSAIALVTSNLETRKLLAADPDLAALKSLVEGLSNLASFDLLNQVETEDASLSLHSLADEVRVVIGQDWEESDGCFTWSVPMDLPAVKAARHGLMQVFLNMSQNAMRAQSGRQGGVFAIEAQMRDAMHVTIAVSDNGPGVSEPRQIFQAFRSHSGSSGLGLYVSRAIIKSFGGELEYVPTEQGCRFEIVLPVAGVDAGLYTQLDANDERATWDKAAR